MDQPPKDPSAVQPLRKKSRRLQGIRSPLSVEVEYRRALFELVAELADDIETQILPLFDHHPLLADSSGQVLVTDSVESILSIYTQQMEGLRDKYLKMRQRFRKMSGKFTKGMDDAARKSFYRMLRRTMGAQTDLVAIVGEKGVTESLFAETESNVNLISSIPNNLFDKVHQLVTQNFIYGSRSTKGLEAELLPLLKKELRDLGPKAKKRAALIARDQTSKISSALSKIRQTNLGVEEYIWRTSKDLRVRGAPNGVYPPVPKDKNHWIREGKVFRWDDPPADGHPGEAINCRCYAEPIIKMPGITTEEVREMHE